MYALSSLTAPSAKADRGEPHVRQSRVPGQYAMSINNMTVTEELRRIQDREVSHRDLPLNLGYFS
jgi:hypothetical protein